MRRPNMHEGCEGFNADLLDSCCQPELHWISYQPYLRLFSMDWIPLSLPWTSAMGHCPRCSWLGTSFAIILRRLLRQLVILQ